MRKIMFLTILAVAFGATFAMAVDRHKVTIENQIMLTGEEPVQGVTTPSNPDLITDSPGTIIGYTTYEYQTNGSTGNRMGVDSQGGRHFLWMKGTGENFPPDTRGVYFNYVDNMGNWLVPEEGQNISQVDGDGYTQLSLTTADNAAAAYHSGGSDIVIYAVDNFPGMGIFSYFDPPDFLSLDCFWPYLTVDRNDNIHIVSQENTGVAGAEQAIGYTRSTDGGSTWSRPDNVDTLMTISQVLTSSPVSDKVAILYTHGRDDVDQYHNDIYYVESEDGLTWDFSGGKVNVTEYGGSETYWAYTDMAAVYDYNDNLNIIWTTFTSIDEELFYPVTLFHYSTGSGMITEVTACPEDWDESCNTGAWNLPIAKMSLGVNEATNAIYAVYTAFSIADASAAGYCNGDIWMNYSIDGGASWSEDVNMTDSQTPGCAMHECDSDHWSSVADKVDGNLHIIYVNDKDAGGTPQTEGGVTDNPVMYLEFPNPVSSVEHSTEIPTTFALSQNYPNPFNAKTNITFNLVDDSDVKISVFDITGAKVTTLVDDRMIAGEHSVNWDASEVASGVYYYSLKTNGEESTRKMTLLK
ncbi:MAG: T9SS type A sorting domain-containing protein [candidate division Zixibacteria bacterium]